MPPDDEFDLDATLDEVHKTADKVATAAHDFDLDETLAPVTDAVAKARAKMEESLPRDDSPHVERPWYDFWSQYTNPTPLERQDNEAWQQSEMRRAQPEVQNRFEHPASIVTRELSPGVGMLMGGPEVGELWMGPWATRGARAAVGGLAGGVTGGVDALARGESPGDAARTAGHDALTGAAVTGGLDLVGGALGSAGRSVQNSANRKLAERALSSAELNDLRAAGGGRTVSLAGQELRDLGITKPRGLGDFFRGNTPERMSENSLDILNNARTELDRSTEALTSAPARDVSQLTSGYDPNPVTVGQAPVDVSPINSRLHSHANELDYAKNPDKARVYRDLAAELTTPAPVREPAPNASFEPVGESQPRMRRSEGPRVADDIAQVPLESRTPELPPDPGALSSEPTGPIEPNAPPMSSQPMDDGNLLDVPPPTGPGEIDTTSHLANTYRANTPEVNKTPILDLEPPPSTRNLDPSAVALTSPAKDLGPKSPEPQTRPFWNPVEMPDDNAFNLLGHDMQNLPARSGGPTVGRFGEVAPAPGNIDVDTSYWPAPYEMSRNEPPLPPQEPGLPPAKQTVLEHTPRFKGDSPAPGLQVDNPNADRDLLGDDTLPATALYPDNPPLPQGELAPPGMSRRAPIVGTIRHAGSAKGSRPPVADLAPGSVEPLDVSDISPTSAPLDSGFFPQTPRPMTPADPSTGFTLDQLMAMRRELGNQTRNFQGRPLNKVEGDMGAATRDAWKGAGDAVTGALDQHVEAGNLTPDIVNSYRDANKTFSTIADVNKNLATRTNADFKTPSSTGNETMLGSGYKATERAKERLLGLNAQYGIGQGLEGIGNVAQAGSDLARMGAGLGWNQNREEHPEIEQARAENPTAPKAAVEQKANNSMKETLQKAWYNVLGAFN